MRPDKNTAACSSWRKLQDTSLTGCLDISAELNDPARTCQLPAALTWGSPSTTETFQNEQAGALTCPQPLLRSFQEATQGRLAGLVGDVHVCFHVCVCACVCVCVCV